MKRALYILLLLGGCSYFQDPGQVEGTIIAPGNFRAGSGVITGVGVLPNANKGKAQPSSAGRRPDPNLYRLSVRMDVGGFQQVDVDNNTFAEGEAVELTNDGRVVRVSGTSLNRAIR
jgi:hypothetical protein